MPVFHKIPHLIEVAPGQTAILSCIVTNLGDQMISWMRSNDLQILTSGLMPFTADYRFSTEYPDAGEDNWGLIIKNTKLSDSGNYECQINTDPKMKINVTLLVREPQLMDIPYAGTTIEGPKDQIVTEGKIISFLCRSPCNLNEHEGINSKRQILWKKDDEIISTQAVRGGISVYTVWGLDSVQSTLTLAQVKRNDSGIYSCYTSEHGYDAVTLTVVDGSDRVHATKFSTNSSTYNIKTKLQLIFVMIAIFICI